MSVDEDVEVVECLRRGKIRLTGLIGSWLIAKDGSVFGGAFPQPSRPPLHLHHDAPLISKLSDLHYRVTANEVVHSAWPSVWSSTT